MDSKLLARIGAGIFVGAVFVVAVVQLREPGGIAPVSGTTGLTAAQDPLARRLRACGELGEQALSSPECRAAWAENRERFFGVSYDEAYAASASRAAEGR